MFPVSFYRGNTNVIEKKKLFPPRIIIKFFQRAQLRVSFEEKRNIWKFSASTETPFSIVQQRMKSILGEIFKDIIHFLCGACFFAATEDFTYYADYIVSKFALVAKGREATFYFIPEFSVSNMETSI